MWISGNANSLATDGVVIAVEKKLPELTDNESVKLIEMLTDHIGVTYAGIGPDFRLLVRLGRAKAQEYARWFKEPISVLMMVKEMANIMQEYTQSGYSFSPLLALASILFSRLVVSVRSACRCWCAALTTCAVRSSSRSIRLAPTSRGRRLALAAA